MSSASLPPLRLCLISDGKAGHTTQLRGLQAGLAQHFQISAELIETNLGLWPCVNVLRQWTREFKGQRVLVAGVGGDTWRYLVLAKKIFGLHTLVLLRPRFWPDAWFDHIVVPRHDELAEGGHIIVTEGVLNPMLPATAPDPNAGLILIGGPSKHHDWDGDALLSQIAFVVKSESNKQWHLTTSRRTPPDFIAQLSALNLPHLTIVPVDETPPDWVKKRLLSSEVVWVTEDSMSMIFEGLSAGIQVGLLTLPRSRTGRVIRSIDDLIERQLVTPITIYQKTNQLLSARPPLQEARRVADIIAPKLLLLNAGNA